MKTQNKETDSEVRAADEDISKMPHQSESTGRLKGHPPIMSTKILKQEQNNTKQPDTNSPSNLIPHRQESTGRPIGLPTLKLNDLLDQEPEITESEEIDTGPPVGNEV